MYSAYIYELTKEQNEYIEKKKRLAVARKSLTKTDRELDRLRDMDPRKVKGEEVKLNLSYSRQLRCECGKLMAEINQMEKEGIENNASRAIEKIREVRKIVAREGSVEIKFNEVGKLTKLEKSKIKTFCKREKIYCDICSKSPIYIMLRRENFMRFKYTRDYFYYLLFYDYEGSPVVDSPDNHFFRMTGRSGNIVRAYIDEDLEERA